MKAREALRAEPPVQGTPAHSQAAASTDHASAIEGVEATEYATLWEWCKVPGTRPETCASLPGIVGDCWGVYGKEKNTDIEMSFQNWQSHFDVDVGLRSYRIIFGPRNGFGTQKDVESGKRRLVRRRVVPMAEWSLALEPAHSNLQTRESHAHSVVQRWIGRLFYCHRTQLLDVLFVPVLVVEKLHGIEGRVSSAVTCVDGQEQHGRGRKGSSSRGMLAPPLPHALPR